MAINIINVHADELEYTSKGLSTRKALPLKPGFHNRVVIERPKKVPAVPVGIGGFARDSSFPTPVSLALLIAPTLRELFDSDAQPVYQVYGYASRDGDEGHNKALSDRRAKVMRALLVADADAFTAVAEEDGWATSEQQVMLRVLHCDPGPIDGEVGPLTTAAVTDFQEDYNDGIFHRHLDTEPRDSQLAVDGILGPKTSKALLDAFVHACSPGIDEAQLHPTHPEVGCSEFNGLPDQAPDSIRNRRASLVIHEELPPFHDAAPCTTGDHAVCPVDDTQPQRCLWYRAHVDDSADERPHLHSDLRWLPLADGRVLLSALTTLPDGETATIQVRRSKPISGPEDIGEGVLADALSDPIAAQAHMGVVHAIWDPGGFDPFDSDDWYTPFTVDELEANPALPFEQPDNLRPPLFTVAGGGALTVSEPPGQQLHRIRLTHQDGQAADDGQTAWGVDNYGRVIQVDLAGRRPGTKGRAVDESVKVVRIEPLQHHLARPSDPTPR